MRTSSALSLTLPPYTPSSAYSRFVLDLHAARHSLTTWRKERPPGALVDQEIEGQTEALRLLARIALT